MKKICRIISAVISMLLVSAFLNSCVPIVGKGALILNDDGSGSRSITVSINKSNPPLDEWGISYYFLKIHGDELAEYLRAVYSEKTPGSDTWLELSVDDSGRDNEIITLNFDFSSFNEYLSRLSSLAFGESASGSYSDPVIKTDSDKVVSYKESIGVIMSVEQSMLNHIIEDDSVFDVSCTKDGKALSTQPASNIAKYGVQSLDDYADPCFTLTVNGTSIELKAENSRFTWALDGFMDPCDITLAVSPADEWTELFRQYGDRKLSWIGADGVYSFALDGNDAFASADENTETFFIFSDTLFGTSSKDGKKAVRSAMPNHTSALLSGNEPIEDNRRFVWGRNGNCSDSLSILGNEREKNLVGKKKWFTDGLVLGDRLYLFCYTPIGLGNVSVDMVEYTITDNTVDYTSCKLTESIPQLSLLDEKGSLIIDYGYAVHVNTKEAGAPDPDGYIYIYGGGAAYEGYVAKIKAEDFPDFTCLRYWNGSDWSENIADSAQILSGVSREYSVTPVVTGPHAGKYIAVYMENCISGNLVYSLGSSPYGPFEMPVRFYTVPEAGEKVVDGNGADDSMVTYNSKAHPHLSKDDKLLVSYNTNVGGGCNTPYTYHPRFVWLDLDMTSEPGDAAISETEVPETEPETEETAGEPEVPTSSDEQDISDAGTEAETEEKPSAASDSAPSLTVVTIVIASLIAVNAAALLVIVIIKKKK